MTQVRFKKLNPMAIPPAFAHDGDAGADLHAIEKVRIMPGEWHHVNTGIAIEIPFGYVGLIHPRSGLAFKMGLTVLNAPGTIDAGYRGELKVILINHSQMPYNVMETDRIAQLVIQKVEIPRYVEVKELSDSVRGEGRFGSTG